MQTIKEKKDFLTAILAGDKQTVKKYLNKKSNFWKIENNKIFRHVKNGWQQVSDENFRRLQSESDCLVCYDDAVIPEGFTGQVIKKPSPERMITWWRSCGCNDEIYKLLNNK
jgi:hypothetical protein